jgi:hypothetical protein
MSLMISCSTVSFTLKACSRIPQEEIGQGIQRSIGGEPGRFFVQRETITEKSPVRVLRSLNIPGLIMVC